MLKKTVYIYGHVSWAERKENHITKINKKSFETVEHLETNIN